MQLNTPSLPTNPVYCEITAVPALNSDIDRRQPHPRSYVNVIGQEDTAAYEVPLPMQSQHVTKRNNESMDSVGGAYDNGGVDLTRNEAYGLIGNVICQGDILGWHL